MARSYRKPYDYNAYGNPGADKRRGRRRVRRIARTVVHTGVDPDGDVYPTRNEVDDPWDWGVDGKIRYSGNVDREGYVEKITRK